LEENETLSIFADEKGEKGFRKEGKTKYVKRGRWASKEAKRGKRIGSNEIAKHYYLKQKRQALL
jgi:hypothetical protein